MTEKDDRVVYSVFCTWWDSIDKAAVMGSGLPCCPTCKSVLYEMREAEWWAGVDRHEAHEPGYRKQLEWAQGKHFKNFTELKKAFEAEHP